MNTKQFQENKNEDRGYVLAMHSAFSDFGVAIANTNGHESSIKNKIFSTGRKLSNNLISCVEMLLPSNEWHLIKRIAVTIGPGGFTSTRLTVVMARTLAQQLGCSLDGISSFSLMAPRLLNELQKKDDNDFAFWISQDIGKRGIIAGKYKINNNKNNLSDKVIEVEIPHLIKDVTKLNPNIFVKENIKSDLIYLLKLCTEKYMANIESKWNRVLPIYPTSPVENN